jgi:hypothetical protein
MKRQFSIADLLSLIASFAVLLAFHRWLGYDGVILATPFGGVIVGRLLTPAISEPARLRRFRGAFAASGLAIAVCLADPRPHVTTAFDLALGIPICFLYGFAAMATLEGLLKIGRWLGEWVTGAGSCCSWLMGSTANLLRWGSGPGFCRFSVPMLLTGHNHPR